MKRSEIKVAPSILSADFSRLGDELKRVQTAGADVIHLDIMDGHFVPNLTFGPYGVSCLRKHTKLPMDVHLMLDSPGAFIGPFAEAGADMISIHIEAAVHIQRSLEEIRTAGCKAGIAINPATPLSALEYAVEYADFLLVMTVNPGFGGQKFLKPMVRKIADARKLVEKRNPACLIEVDGGIDSSTAIDVIKAGATILVAGNAVFKTGDYAAAIDGIRGKG